MHSDSTAMRAFALTDKVALITGGTAGIGHATAKQFVAAGANVIITGRRASGAQIAAELGAHFVPAELAHIAEINALFGQIDALDILVNNAGIFPAGASLSATGDDELDRAVAINVRAPFQVLRAAVPKLRTGGSIVNVASVSGMTGGAGSAVYAATKAAIINLTQSLALELAGRIRVNAVSPGPIATDMWPDSAPLRPLLKTLLPMGRIGQPLEVALAIQFLCSDAASFVTGHNLVVDGCYVAGDSPTLIRRLLQEQRP